MSEHLAFPTLLLLVMILAVALTPGHAQSSEEVVHYPENFNVGRYDLDAAVDNIAVMSTQPTPISWTLEGRVYEGEVGTEKRPLDGVTVSVYGANDPYPNPGVWIAASTTADEYGWYGIAVPEGYEYYFIRETDLPGYVSVGATSVNGVVRSSNEIEYNLNRPLKDQTLTGNKFWDLRETEPLPTQKGPDLAILSAENWAFEDDGLVLQLLVEIANHGDSRADQTRVYAGDPQHDWPGRESLVPAFNPEGMIQEIDERNNVGWTPSIFIPPLEVTPPPTEPSPSPTTTPVLPEPDQVPLILIVVTIAALGCITLIIRHYTITKHHKKWQMEAKEEEPPEHCQYCTHHCRKIELEPAIRKIAYLYLSAYDPVHGEQIKEVQVTGEIVDALNKVVAARHRHENAEKLQEQVTLLAHALLQQIIGLLRDELAPRDISVTGHLEGGKVTCQFILYHCKRSGTMNIWEEVAKWKATIADERDEPVGTLRSIDPAESMISERQTPALTRLLMQFIEKM
ncbi:hypothetical protein C5S53_15565 [Methanophagales archaeon]|nr:hypothetical protein C5S53_15565 [Methanophagales archaeon]